MTKKPLILHPFLFALGPVCFLLAHNVSEVAVSDALLPAGVVLVLAAVLLGLARLLFRSWEKAALVVSTLLFLFFTYGHLAGAILGWRVGGVLLGRPRNILIAQAVVAIVVAVLVLRTRRSLRGLTSFLNFGAGIFVAISIVQIAVHASGQRPTSSTDVAAVAEDIVLPPAPNPAPAPDIVYIILDSYGRADILKEMYNYDNGAFLDYLRQKGFYVADRSRSNYAYTGSSLASSLNTCYLDKLVQQVGKRTRTITPLAAMIRGSRVTRALQERGYRFVAFASGCTTTEMPDADIYLRPGRSLNVFETGLLAMTPVPVVIDALVGGNASYGYGSHRKRILYAFDHLKDVAEMKGPVFVFAHIIAPHQPFVFDEHGKPLTPEGPYSLNMTARQRAHPEEYKGPYKQEMTFVNAKVREVIDALLAAPEPPIIILQGDHGPGSRLHHGNVEQTDMRERFAILNAYYFPDGDYAALYAGISPINTFRVILNKCFGAGLELLPDESYFTTSRHEYGYVNVTEAAKAPAPPTQPE